MTALVLIGLDVALQAPASRLTALLAWPTQWLAGWMDPGKPLVGPGKLATATPAAKPAASGSSNPFGALGYVPKLFGY